MKRSQNKRLKKGSKRRIKKNVRNAFLLILLGVLATYAGFFLQRKENFVNVPVSVAYSTVDTKEVYTASMVMVGDALIHGAVYNTYRTGNTYDFKNIFKYTKDIFKSYDLAYYNQETILGGKSLGLSTYPQFNSPQEVGDAFMDAGFDLVSLATNHTLDRMYDCGMKTITNSREYWNKQEGVIAAGSYTSKEEREKLQIQEVNGIKYTLLSYTMQTNGLPVPNGKSYVVDVYNKEKVKQDVERYKDKVDVIMVAMHWGNEYQHYPSTNQKSVAKYLASLGVNIIIGAHPHVVQPIDFIDDTLVIYSLGNFVSAQIGTEKLTGLLASIVIKKEVYHGKTTITIEDVVGDLIYTNKTNKYVVYPYSKLSNNILYNYRSYYDKYGKIVTAYSDKVTMKGI